MSIKSILQGAFAWIVAYIKTNRQEDKRYKYGLKEAVTFTIKQGKSTVPIQPNDFRGQVSTDHILLDITDDVVKIIILPFPPESDLWNGVSMVPDAASESLLRASLLHDVLWADSKQLAQCLGMMVDDFITWSNKAFVAAAKIKCKLQSKIIYHSVSLGYKAKKLGVEWLIAILLSISVFTGCGCIDYSYEDWDIESDYSPTNTTLFIK